MKTKIDDIFVNDKGRIINILFEPVQSVAIIESKAGSIRSNHYHKSDAHWLYVVSGSMKYYERDLDGSNRVEVVVNAGEMIFSDAMKVHKTEFPVDTVLISMAKKIRDHEHHEEDVVREEY